MNGQMVMISKSFSTLSCFKVDQKTLHDFIYGCLHIFDQKLCQKVFAIGDGHYALAIETDDQGKLCIEVF